MALTTDKAPHADEPATHNPKDDAAIVKRHHEEQAALERHRRRQDANLDVSLNALPELVGKVAALLEVGATVDELADHVGPQLQFSDPDAVDALAKVLTAAHKHVKKAADDRAKAEDARAKAEDQQHKADGE
jgi:hypothetical protein